MADCPYCGLHVQASAKLCPSCGQPLEDAPVSTLSGNGDTITRVPLVCPQCNAQFRRLIDALDAVHAVECPKCKTGFESLLVTIIEKRSTGDPQRNSRRFSITVLDPLDSEALVEFSRQSYRDIELRPDDDVILSYLQEQLAVVQNLTLGHYDRLIPFGQKRRKRTPTRKKPQKRTWVWIAIGVISVLPLLCFATALAFPISPFTLKPKLAATALPYQAPPAAETLPLESTEGRLWCPDCAAKGQGLILWEKGSAEISGVRGVGKHGDEVDVLSREHNLSENKTYYLVKVKTSDAKGWVPETLIRFEPPNDGAATIEDPIVYYVVQAGDTLGTIAQNHGVTIQWIVDRNGIQNPDLIEVGQELIVGVPADWTPSPAQP